MSYTFQYRNWDYAFNEIYVNSPQVHIDVQELLNSIRAQEASERGIVYPQIAEASGKDALSGSVSTGITVNLLNDWEVEWYVGDYVATVDGGNLVAASGNVFHPVVGGPQIEILRSAAATIVTTGGSALASDERAKLMGIPSTPLLAASYIAPDNAGIAAIQASVDTMQGGITSTLTHLIAMSKWKNNRLARTSAVGTIETWVLYDDDSTTPLLTWTYNTQNLTRSKAV